MSMCSPLNSLALHCSNSPTHLRTDTHHILHHICNPPKPCSTGTKGWQQIAEEEGGAEHALNCRGGLLEAVSNLMLVLVQPTLAPGTASIDRIYALLTLALFESARLFQVHAS